MLFIRLPTLQMEKYRLTPKEHKKIKANFEKLLIQQKDFREAYIRAVQEGDERENDGWYVTHDLNNQNIARLKEWDKILKNCVIVDVDNEDESVSLGDKVVLKINGGQPKEFELVSFVGVSTNPNVVSPDSPIGQAILGAKPNQIVEFFNGEKMFKVEVVSVS